MLSTGNFRENRFIGDNLRYFRKMRGYTRTRLAELMLENSMEAESANATYIKKYEEYESKPLDVNVRALADALKIPYTYLICPLEEISETEKALTKADYNQFLKELERRKSNNVDQPMLKAFTIKELSNELNKRLQEDQGIK